MNNDNKRATGRTLGLALQALGKAIENPGTEVEFIDHHCPSSHAQLSLYKNQIELLAKKLNLDVSVDFRSFSIFIKSNWVSPYAQRTPLDEAFKNNYGVYSDELKSVDDQKCWISFKRGFEAAQNT